MIAMGALKMSKLTGREGGKEGEAPPPSGLRQTPPRHASQAEAEGSRSCLGSWLVYKSIMGQNSHRSCHNFMSAWPGIRLGERCKRDARDECSRGGWWESGGEDGQRELGTLQMKHVLVLSHLLTTPWGRFAGRDGDGDGQAAKSVSEIKQWTPSNVFGGRTSSS